MIKQWQSVEQLIPTPQKTTTPLMLHYSTPFSRQTRIRNDRHAVTFPEYQIRPSSFCIGKNFLSPIACMAIGGVPHTTNEMLKGSRPTTVLSPERRGPSNNQSLCGCSKSPFLIPPRATREMKLKRRSAEMRKSRRASKSGVER